MNIFKNNAIIYPKSKKTGAIMENLACDYLKEQGLILILRNYRCKMGELDLIMRDHHYLVFVEVRYRKQINYGSSLESINYTKQNKLIKTAEYYLLKNNLTFNCFARFDVIAIDKTSDLAGECHLKIDWLKNVIELR